MSIAVSTSARACRAMLSRYRRTRKNIQHTVRYSELSPARFKDFWRR